MLAGPFSRMGKSAHEKSNYFNSTIKRVNASACNFHFQSTGMLEEDEQ